MVKRGIYYFDAKPLLVKGWNPEMDLNTESINALLLWLQLLDLDVNYWGLESLSKIGSILSIPIKIDRYTNERSVIKYARLLIEISLEGPFPNYIEFFNDDEVLVR